MEKKENKKDFKFGTVAVIGKANVGKSTIINHLMGYKVSIVTPKPETTRNRITAILTTNDAQIVFIDTPGIHKAKTLLGRNMVRNARETLDDIDCLVCVFDMVKKISPEDENIVRIIRASDVPKIAVINKIDKRKKALALPLIEQISDMNGFDEIIPVSAEKGDNMPELLENIIRVLPRGERMYPDDYVTNKTMRFMVGEIIREKALICTRQEIPHALAVFVEDFEERPDKDVLYVRATVYVERQSQKKIVIGRKGEMLKRIGSMARREMELFVDKKVYLDIWVKVYPNWRKDPRALKKLEYL